MIVVAMNESISLSKRLLAIAELVPKDVRLIDVGTDRMREQRVKRFSMFVIHTIPPRYVPQPCTTTTRVRCVRSTRVHLRKTEQVGVMT